LRQDEASATAIDEPTMQKSDADDPRARRPSGARADGPSDLSAPSCFVRSRRRCLLPRTAASAPDGERSFDSLSTPRWLIAKPCFSAASSARWAGAPSSQSVLH